MRRDWRNAADYADLESLDLSGVAWEFLRRNPDYVSAFAVSSPDVGDPVDRASTWRFGLRFPLDPLSPAQGAALFWRADIAPAHVVVLVPDPSGGSKRDDLLRLASAVRHADDGLHLRLDAGLQLHILDDTRPSEGLSAVVGLDTLTDARLAAVATLARLLGARGATLDPRSAYRRRRRLLMLRALDARAESASYRDIAQVLLQAMIGDSSAWRTSSARDVAIRLCRSGHGLASGGYRRLLRRRR